MTKDSGSLAPTETVSRRRDPLRWGHGALAWFGVKLVFYFALGVTLGRLLGGCSRGEDPPDAAEVCDPPCELGDSCYRGMCLPSSFCGIEFCPEDEICNGVDDDQDGRVDESTLGTPLSRFCMSTCGTGAAVCVSGFWGACMGPESRPEVGTLCHDGEDNDCDGRIDEDATNPVDVALLIDRSGSMGDEIAAVRAGVSAFGASADPSWQFAVVTFPGEFSRGWLVDADLGPWPAAEAALGAIRLSGTSEPSYDLLAAAGTGTLPLSWRPDATRLVFLFTDEPGQSYLDPPLSEREACGHFTHGEVVVIYTETPRDFDACGATRPLPDVARIVTDLADPCAPDL